MKVIIQLSIREEAKALPILLRHSVGTMLRDRMYVLDESAVTALREAKIKFTEINREANNPGGRIVDLKSANRQPRQPGSAIGVLSVVEDDKEHLTHFREYMP